MKASELPKTKYGTVKCYNSTTNETIMPIGFKTTLVDHATLRSMKIDFAPAILGFHKYIRNGQIKWFPKLTTIVSKKERLHGLFQVRNRIVEKYGNDIANWLIPKE